MGLRTLSLLLAASLVVLPGFKLQTEYSSATSSGQIEQLPATFKNVRLIAHRGVAVLAPENTLPAVELAGQYGYYGCEFDVYPSRDGVWMVSHDGDLSRMTDAAGAISDFTYEKLKNVTVDAGANIQSYPNLKLCTLEEALEACSSYRMVPVIELKGGTAKQIADLVQLLKDRQMDGTCVITSFDFGKLQSVRNASAQILELYLTGVITREAISSAVSLGNAGVDFLDSADHSAALIQEAKADGLTLFAWGVHDITSVQRLSLLGVDAVTVDGIVP